ncbi:hypothetical protein V6N12_067715 [Hibiscus sabdariffa]|uniref:Uncharacterized protein n=1 Tax=Hibiscus sabdariffa TaxID=183260 RepID=A0ABR2A0R2_9ROSI
MNLSASRCGSGCESGWTFYLDQSFSSQTWSGVNGARFMAEDEEEGLSMVSDASSGPRPCYCQDYAECPDENGSFCSHPATPEQPVKKNSKIKKQIKQHSCLDDTASSPLINFSQASSTILYTCLHQYGYCVDLKVWCIYRRTSRKKLQQSCRTFHKVFRGKSAFQKELGFLKSGKTSYQHAGGFQERSRE